MSLQSRIQLVLYGLVPFLVGGFMMSRPQGVAKIIGGAIGACGLAAIAYGVYPYLPLTVAIVSGYIIYVGVVLVSAMSYGDNRIMHLFGWLVLACGAVSLVLSIAGSPVGQYFGPFKSVADLGWGVVRTIADNIGSVISAG